MRRIIILAAIAAIAATTAVWSIAMFAKPKVAGQVRATETSAPVSPHEIMVKQGRSIPVGILGPSVLSKPRAVREETSMSDRTARSNYSPLLSQRQGAKSFSQGFWPCHSTDRASGTFSAITASGATRTVKAKKTTDSCAGNRPIASLPIVGG